MAARAGVRQSFLEPYNYVLTIQLQQLMLLIFANTGVSSLILASTSSIYGDSGENLMRENKMKEFNPPPFMLVQNYQEKYCKNNT